MRAIGFAFAQNDFRYAVLEDGTPYPTLLHKERIAYPQNMELPELMGWTETQLQLILTKYPTDRVGHKISHVVKTIKQVKYGCLPQGILNLIVHKKNIPTTAYSPTAVNTSRFGLAKGTDLMEHADTALGTHPPHWDKLTKEAALIAWLTLL